MTPARGLRSVFKSKIVLAGLAIVCLGEIGSLIALHVGGSNQNDGPPPSTAPKVQRPVGLVVHIEHPTASFQSPGGPRAGSIAPTWHGAPAFLPVIEIRSGYDEVRLLTRPNGSTTWIRASGVLTSHTSYRIVIDLGTRHLLLYRNGIVLLDAPAGIGTVANPTPTGQFFVAFFANPPAPNWGPFVIVTSAHSNTITDWEESGDALIAIHGPLGPRADAAIGATGARISHGCVRLHDPELQRLRAVPVGTPVDIIS